MDSQTTEIVQCGEPNLSSKSMTCSATSAAIFLARLAAVWLASFGAASRAPADGVAATASAADYRVVSD
jgi:hypothetical protein